MARKTLAERLSDALSELEMAKARLVNLELTDDQVREEFDKIVERISKGN
ncbi:TPA: hypothetical protein RKW40_001936 [Escherichia coli]|nr:hypothetical protein [Escherichia coli]